VPSSRVSDYESATEEDAPPTVVLTA
jgi:hypothetical protein